jgi:uncharacterized metal-binding protein YceD (DUF177 family)
MNENFIIPLNGLTAGKNEFFLHAGKEFFDSFENEEIFDADLQIRVLVEKSGRYIGVDCDIEGEVTVECDRCLEMLDMPVDVQVRLSVKFGEEEASEIGQETEREVIFVKEDEAELDMSQIIYDYACLALPMQRVHEDGECDPEAMKYYGLRAEPDGSAEEDGENPFSALKNMFK